MLEVQGGESLVAQEGPFAIYAKPNIGGSLKGISDDAVVVVVVTAGKTL